MLNEVKISEVHAPISVAANTDANSDRLDMSGWDGVMFIQPVEDSVATGVATLKVEQNTADSDTGMAALSDATATATCAVHDDLNGKLLIVDVYQPTKRYVQGVVTSATANIAFGTMIAIQYRGKKAPVTQGSTVLDSAFVAGPAEG